jgi:hypothetical protein
VGRTTNDVRAGLPARRRLYVSVTGKFVVVQLLAAGWLGISVWLSLPWVRELAGAITIVRATGPVPWPRRTAPAKSHALNTGLAAVGTDLAITLDADTLLHPRAVAAAGGWPDTIGEDIVLLPIPPSTSPTRWCGSPPGPGGDGLLLDRRPLHLAVLLLTMVVNLILYRFQRRRVFNPLGLRVLAYRMLMSPVALAGYGQELLGLRRRWK